MLFPILRDQLKFLRERGYDVHTASIDGALGRRIRDEDGFPWTPLPLTREFDPFGDWKAMSFIAELCRREKFDIVHTHTPKGNLVGQIAARRAGVPIVLQTLHGFYFHERMPAAKKKIWMALERLSAAHSDHVLCQNPEDVETALNAGIVKPGEITLLGNGIDLERFKPVCERTSNEKAGETPTLRSRKRELNIPERALVVGMVGRFVAEKGFPEFLRAGAILCAEFPDLHLLAIGHKLESERKGERWEPEDFSELRGRMTVLSDRDDMPDLYGCMDVHVLPSHREGFPRALMEGAAAGLPQVATNIRGCRQTVEDGRTGYLIRVGDVSELAARLRELLSSPDLRRRMGEAARAKALAEFDQRCVFEKVDACYQGLLERQGRGKA